MPGEKEPRLLRLDVGYWSTLAEQAFILFIF